MAAEKHVAHLSPNTRAMLLNILWHHQGGSSVVGHHVREILGIASYGTLSQEQVVTARYVERQISGVVLDPGMVTVPVDADHAAAMVMVGTAWLQLRAPDRLKPTPEAIESNAAQAAKDVELAREPKPDSANWRESLIDLINEHVGGALFCHRTWSAWGVGTMSESDFSPVSESNNPAELADAIIEKFFPE